MRGVCAVSPDKGPCARHASRVLRRACGQGAVLSLCIVRPGSGRFGVGFWVGFWVGLRAWGFPTERVLSRTPLIIRIVDRNNTVNSRQQLRISENFVPPSVMPRSRLAHSLFISLLNSPSSLLLKKKLPLSSLLHRDDISSSITSWHIAISCLSLHHSSLGAHAPSSSSSLLSCAA
jgi:hypothetical protein